MPAKSTTLTQRRGGSSKSKSSKTQTSSKSSKEPTLSPLGGGMSGMNVPSSEGGSVLKIVIWGILILAVGIGLALGVRNMTETNTNESETDQTEEATVPEEEESVAVEPEEEEVEEPIVEETTDEVAEEPMDEPMEEPETTEQTAETVAGSGLTNDYSTQDQDIGDGLTTNAVTITGYNYSTYSDRFSYNIKLSNTTNYPNVSATLDESANTLTVKVSNISSDNIVGNGGTGSTDFAAPRNTQSVDISNSSNVSTFVFNLSTSTEYKINAVEEDEAKMIRVEIKNS